MNGISRWSLRVALLVSLATPRVFGQDNVPSASIQVPSPNAPTIQIAIQSLPNGGTVLIRPGLYRESLLIEGKQIILRGSTRGSTIIQGVDAESGVVTFARGGGGAIEHLNLVGGKFGVNVEEPLPGQTPQPPSNTDVLLPPQLAPLTDVAIRNSRIIRSGTGVAGSFRRLEVSGLEVLGSRLHGLSLGVTDQLMFDGLDVRNSEGYGLVVYNLMPPPGGGAVRVIQNSKFFENAGGGVFIRGGALPFELLNNIFYKNQVSAVTLHGAHNTHVDFSYFLQTFAGPGKPEWGDGVRNLASRDVLVENSQFSLNHRAAISVIGCGDGREAKASLKNNTITKNGLEINIEPIGFVGCTTAQSTPMAIDLGGNKCAKPTCVASSSVLEPIKSPTP
jgi:hypothetical protein